MTRVTPTWPKQLPTLTPEQEAIRDDWMKYFYESVYTDRFSMIQRFNHTYAARSALPGLRTLDLGAGLGEHLEYEDGRAGEYVALELRPEMAAVIEQHHPYVRTISGDVQQRLDFDEGFFDRVVAIHILEHLPNLPGALDELTRLVKPGGSLSVVLPCEGGRVYGLGRRLTTQRIFEKRYGVSFDWAIKSEHVNELTEIIDELDARFVRVDTGWFPTHVPTVHLNVCCGLTYMRDLRTR
jgi:SAM-dependent methyltransferase